MPDQHVFRISDAHPTRGLQVTIETNGDVWVKITQDESNIEESHDCVSVLEFCTSGDRSRHTREALYELFKAMEKDNAENPIDPN